MSQTERFLQVNFGHWFGALGNPEPVLPFMSENQCILWTGLARSVSAIEVVSARKAPSPPGLIPSLSIPVPCVTTVVQMVVKYDV